MPSAAKQRVSKKSARAEAGGPAARSRAEDPRVNRLFQELARLAELSSVERELRARGFRLIAGTDEVGRGSLAGPVVAAAVVFDCDPPAFGVNDSKKLTPEQRREVMHALTRCARAIAIGVVEPAVIDSINILRASKLAMSRAVEQLLPRPEVLLLDAVGLETLELPQLALIHGDARSVSIAAASVVAKVYRDELMESYHDAWPEYDFLNNRGYGTSAHSDALRRLGPTPIHRQTFLGERGAATLFD